mgnify:FL=1
MMVIVLLLLIRHESLIANENVCEDDYNIIIKNIQRDRPVMRNDESYNGGEILMPYYYKSEDLND